MSSLIKVVVIRGGHHTRVFSFKKKSHCIYIYILDIIIHYAYYLYLLYRIIITILYYYITRLNSDTVIYRVKNIGAIYKHILLL